MECLLPDISIPKQFLQVFLNAKNTLKERCHLLSCLLLCFPLFLFSQPEIAKIQRFGEKEGLGLLINQIFQDEKGMLWLLGWHDNPFFHEVESHLIQFDGRDFRTIDDRPNLDVVMFRLSRTNDKQLIINYLGPHFDIFDTQTGHFETVDLNFLSNEVQRVWSSSEAKIPYTFAVKTVPEVKLFSWDEKQLDTICTIPRQESGLQLWGYFQHEDFTWVSDAGIGWVKYDHTSGQLYQYTAKDFTSPISFIDPGEPISFAKAIVTSAGEILVAVRNVLPGYFLYDQEQGKFKAISGLPNDIDSHLPVKDKAGRILFTYWPSSGQRRALWLLDLDGKLIDYSHVLESLDASMFCVYSSDFNDHLWVGTYTGLAFIKLRSKEKSIEQLPTPFSMRSIIELEAGKLLLSTELNGWFLWDEARDTLLPFTIFQNGSPIGTNFCRGFFKDKDGWIWASNLHGLVKFNPITQEAIFYKASIQIQAFTKMKNGHFLLVGDNHPVPIEFDPVNGFFSDFIPATTEPALSERFSHSILEAKNGVVWVGTNRGLLCYDKKLSEVRLFSKKDGLKSNVILYLSEAGDGKLWMGMGGAGVHIFDPETQQFEYLQEKDGLANNTVAGILKDADGDMWFSTFDGISCYKPEGGTFLNFNQEDGFSHHEFNRYSFYQKPDGQFCFGTLNGMNIFDPKTLKGKPSFPRLLLTEAQFYDQREGQQKVHHYGLSQLTSIKLPPNNRYLRFKFALSDFENADRHKFAYFLEGYDNDWNPLGNKNEITFNKLPVGNYTLHLQGLNARGEFNVNPVTIDIHIAQYFYKSAWFYFLCLAFAGSAVFWWILRLRSQKQLLEAEVRKRTESIRQDKLVIEEQASQLQELDRFKSRFYTNITHEFRTPLTVILGMLEEIRGHEKPRKLIKRNSQNLLNLINQLLDLSKIESGKIELNLSQGDVIHYVMYLTESFHSLAESRNIRLQTYSEVDELFMAFDPEKLQHIIGNLLSNAIKFTPERGKITLHMAVNEAPSPLLIIKVKDNGIGIDPKKLSHIFDLFYQADPENYQGGSRKDSSSGIGLAFVKELVELMNGRISVESEVGKGTSFEVQLPITHVEPTTDMEEAAIVMEENPDETTKLYAHVLTQRDSSNLVQEKTGLTNQNQPLLLIIEDNPDVATYIESCLQSDYQLAIAYNGQEGIDKAFELIPDLIVSDVMMPKKNGYEVCNTLKNDIRTSHIPIVLLTAKIDAASRIEGLEKGADAYLAKPFDKKELLVRLKKLNELRRQLQEKYATDGKVVSKKDPQITSETATPLEEAFIQKLREAIEKQIDDPGLGVVHLCRAVHLSHPQVYRKIKALTGQSPSVFIRSIRLQKGLELLKNQDKTVADVAYEVGFSDPNYFSRTFHEHFGKTPSEMRN